MKNKNLNWAVQLIEFASVCFLGFAVLMPIGALAQELESPDSEAAAERPADPTESAGDAVGSDSEESLEGEPTSDEKSSAEKPSAEKPSAEKPSAEKPSAEKSARPKEVSAAQSETDEGFHTLTPVELRNRLRFSVGASLGTGLGPRSFASDFLAVSIGTAYSVGRLEALGFPLVWSVVGSYWSQTGVDQDASLDVVIQRFLVGGGLEVTPNGSKLRYGAQAQIGLSRAAAADFAPDNAYETEHGVALSLAGHARYQVVPSIWALAGLEIVPISGDYSWYGITLGSTLSF